MAWLWSSFQELVDYVQPVMVDRGGVFRLALRDSWFETQRRLYTSVERLGTSLQSLRELGFTSDDHAELPRDHSLLDTAHGLALDVVLFGEELLLYHRRLARSPASYGFLHQHDMIEHWDRYCETGRIFREIARLVQDTEGLLAGYEEIVQADNSFLVEDLDLPSELETDFRLARNLFSVGFDEVGVLIAGRGLEGVLRKVANVRKIRLMVGGKSSPAHIADTHDLIETLYRIRWKASGARLMSAEMRALMHYLRSVRNWGAHPAPGERRPPVSPRETATVVARNANRLWHDCTGTRARLDNTVVQRNW